jgi:Photosynthetic reaction centre cytochrome C subunit
MHLRSAILLVAGVAVVTARPAAAQGHFPPDSFTNLKVLPKNIPVRTLINTMRGFTEALGVRCPFCHVGREGQPLDSFNFASDEKRPKRVARVMLHMVMHINEEHLAEVPDRPQPVVEVRCATCHRGITRPRLLDDEMRLVLADSGLEAAVRRYRELRERYYGSGAYDFREGVLNEVARGEAIARRPENAIGLLQLNAEYYPASGTIPYLQGEIRLQQGDTTAAVAAFRDALAKDSTIVPARRRLTALTGQGPR